MSDTVVPLRTVLCKVSGCTDEADTLRGRYAHLCKRHRTAASSERAAEATTTPKTASAAPVEGYESRARLAAPLLIAAGRDIDRAMAKLKGARMAKNVAVHEWNQALRILSGKPVNEESES